MASQKITFPSENKSGPCPGALAGDPKSCSKGLIVLQEWWGMNEQIQECGRNMSAKGPFVTLVPDLYRGKVTTDNEEAGHFMGNLDWPGAIADIRGAARYLKEQGVKKVGVTGFCMGGALTIAAAALIPEIDASSAFYGIPSAELCDPTKITTPLQCHFALKDATAGFASPTEWKPFKAKMEAALKGCEIFEYDAEHAFTNITSPNYNKEAAELSFSRMIPFFQTHLA